MKFSDSQDHSLLEVSVTFHPEAIRQALFGRQGCLLRLLRMTCFLGMLYLAMGWEMCSPRFFPELAFHPLPLLLAFLSLRCPMGLPMTLALVAGILLDGGTASPLGVHPLALLLSTGAVAILEKSPLFPQNPRGWHAAALAGGGAHFFYAAACLCLAGNGKDALWQLGAGTPLAALGYMPALACFLDALLGNMEEP